MKASKYTLRTLLALALGMVMVQAAEGFIVQPEQERMVRPGMSRAEVRILLGEPSTNVKYPNEPGRTWTYNVAGKMDPHVVFDVDFNAEGTVASSMERTLPPTK